MNNYLENRKAFIEKLKDDSFVVLYSGAEKQSSADESYKFLVNMNFFYLTGIDQENVYLVIKKKEGKVEESIYQYKNDPVKVRWIGAYLEKEETTAISGIENVHYCEDFEEDFKKLINSSYKIAYLDLEDSGFKGQVDFGYVFKEKIEKLNPSIDIEDCYRMITSLRAVKKPYEIEIFRKAVDITRVALEDVMSRITSMNYEYEAQGVFEGSIRAQANCGVSFHTISAAGKNAAILHYSSNHSKWNEGDMLLMDLGACYNKYHADITRTYPTNGKYSPLQRKVYQIVLDCNKMVKASARPGVSIRELQAKVVDFLAEGMLKEGLMKNKEDIKNYYYHGISHHIGLDTHDPCEEGYRDGTLKPGMIISNEPGLYIEELNIGVRIEDDLLITEDGCEELSKDIIKEMDEIEEFIAKNKKNY